MKRQWIIGVVALVTVFSVVSIGLALNGTFSEGTVSVTNSNVDINLSSGSVDLGDSDPEFGAQGRGDTRMPNGDLLARMFLAENGYTLTDDWRATSTATIQDGFTWDTLQVELNATSSASIVNPFDETIYVLNTSYVRIITATTSIVSYQMGTSTTGIVAQENSCAVKGTCTVGGTVVNAGILNSASTTPVANFTYFKEDYDGTVAREFLPVADNEYLTCNVSSLASAGYTTGGQGANCVFQYFRIYN